MAGGRDVGSCEVDIFIFGIVLFYLYTLLYLYVFFFVFFFFFMVYCSLATTEVVATIFAQGGLFLICLASHGSGGEVVEQEVVVASPPLGKDSIMHR